MAEREHQYRLLIVDDADVLRESLKDLFLDEGYIVSEACSGAEALSLLAAEPFDVMLLDMKMPVMDGVEVMRRVHRDYPELAVIVMTGHASLDSAITAVRTGAWDYIVKPFDYEDLVTAVSGAILSVTAERERHELLNTISQTVAVLQGSLARDDTPPPSTRSAPTPASPTLSDLPVRSNDILQIGSLVLDREKRQVTMQGDDREPEDLTEGESAVLEVLMEAADTVLSCEEIAAAALDYEEMEHWEAENVVRPYVFRLRRKIEDDPRNPQRICTVRGRGYFFQLP
mgnify:CR=1 FL=1